MPNKCKGSNAERELVHMFWKHPEWASSRIAGSGSCKYPSPDILAGNAIRKLAIEAKATKDTKKYFPKEEIDDLRLFSLKFGAEPWIAIKFKAKEWRFLSLEDLEKTENAFAVSIELSESKGLLFNELINGD